MLTNYTHSVTISFPSLNTTVFKGVCSVNLILKRIAFLTILTCLIFVLSITAMATADTFRTTDYVNFRTSPSTDASIIKTLGTGVNVEMLEHDPAGWSTVKVSGTVGYVRSDFLMLPIGSSPATFKTTDGVNFRSSPSTDASIIKTVYVGTNVDVHEHDPAGWSKVKISGTTGYIRSDFLARPSQSTQSDSSGATTQSQSAAIYRTTAGVNFRTSPSTDAEIIKTLKAGVNVEMVDYNPDGWSKVRVDGTVGYIKSEFLSAGGSVELVDWSVAKSIVPQGVSMRVVDVRTGLSFNLKCFSKSGHADVEPPTKADTDTILQTRGGVWAWAPRPVWVTIGDRTFAAALNGMPHAGSTIPGNGMNGHLCLHFNGTVTNSKTYQRDLNNAVVEAWNAAQR